MRPTNLLKGIFSSSSVCLGLDIGNFSVKLAQIKKKSLSKERILSFAVAPIKGEKTRDRIIEAIRQACDNLATDSKKVNLSIGGPNIIIRYLVLPWMKEGDLSKALEFELERYIPFKREEAVIDYHVLGKLLNNQIIVLLAAAERWLIQERVNLIKDAGLEPQLINIDAIALTEAFKAASPHAKGAVGFLDIGYRVSKLIVLERDIPYFSRDIEIGEHDIIQTVSEKIGIDFNLAKQWAYYSDDKIKEIAEVTKLTINTLLNELSLSFEYCERNLEKKVGQLYLSGGGSKIKVLLDALEKAQGLKVNNLDPTQGFRLSSSITAEDLKEYAHLLAVAIGLAIS